MEIIFKILCGILYCIGLAFVYDYKEISVFICIYGCPIICILTALLINVIITNKLFSKFTAIRVFYFLISYVYLAFNLTFFAKICEHYSNDNIHYLFDQCVKDFQYLAASCNSTYEYCNIVIYVYLFFGIVAFNLLIAFLLKKYLKNSR